MSDAPTTRTPTTDRPVPDHVTSYEQPHADRRDLLPQHPAYACTNCGHWQRWPAPGPQVCPVCADVRNALPEHGFEFLTPKQADELVTGFWRPTAVAGIFPNDDALIRLVGALQSRDQRTVAGPLHDAGNLRRNAG